MNLNYRILGPLVLGVFLLVSDYAPSVRADVDFHVVALFKDRVVVMIDGKRRLLRSGEVSPEGVKLISANSDGAVFEYHGQVVERRLDGRVRAAAKRPKSADGVTIYRNAWGMFHTVGSINGLPVEFLIDTGASSVAMNAAQARRLGIDYHVEGNTTYVATASDVVKAYQVKLDVVKVGTIELRNVTGVVMEGGQPSDVLLGMSFLGRLEMINQADRMVLRRKY